MARLLFFVGLLITCTVCASTWQTEVKGINTSIKKLTDLRNLELAKAARYQDQGDRLQFNSNNLVDARRYWDQAEVSREIAARYQEEIDKLELKKNEILKQHGALDGSAAH
ncbi:MAG: hypothetical protein SP1CHLAM54_03910 [Chlamydiia bacterium]|nr:hypothetical protein [Chlamydiia bacterium]MCH9615306.1 hypothetical protein [Chlamydiia bacterium]MCH9628372.1 hypothetical protein [Chlamydiia bacterium]